MVDWKKIGLLFVGIFLVIIQSFFLFLGLTIIWALIIGWIIDEPWWLFLVVGLLTDIFYLNPLGKTALILIAVGLITKYLKNILGFRESYKMKVSRF